MLGIESIMDYCELFDRKHQFVLVHRSRSLVRPKTGGRVRSDRRASRLRISPNRASLEKRKERRFTVRSFPCGPPVLSPPNPRSPAHVQMIVTTVTVSSHGVAAVPRRQLLRGGISVTGSRYRTVTVVVQTAVKAAHEAATSTLTATDHSRLPQSQRGLEPPAQTDKLHIVARVTDTGNGVNLFMQVKRFVTLRSGAGGGRTPPRGLPWSSVHVGGEGEQRAV